MISEYHRKAEGNRWRPVWAILVPLVTPFDRNEEVDLVRYAQLAEYVIAQKYSDSIVVTGTTGEFNTLTADERAKLFDNGAESGRRQGAGHRRVGCASTRETWLSPRKPKNRGGLHNDRRPLLLQADAGCSVRALRIVHDATNIPITALQYSIFTGINMEPALVGGLPPCRVSLESRMKPA